MAGNNADETNPILLVRRLSTLDAPTPPRRRLSVRDFAFAASFGVSSSTIVVVAVLAVTHVYADRFGTVLAMVGMIAVAVVAVLATRALQHRRFDKIETMLELLADNQATLDEKQRQTLEFLSSMWLNFGQRMDDLPGWIHRYGETKATEARADLVLDADRPTGTNGYTGPARPGQLYSVPRN